ncbi:MAG TPA: hypothetical protein VMV81_00825 [Phycisphaerae bacterium]|nr:hypothetical protein [Phycisphaerae bacterium]
MHRSIRFTFPTLFSAIALLACTFALAEPRSEAPPFPWEGEVTGTNVYVRSGAGNNWYPTAKLSGGDRVLVMGEKIGWYQIAPPAGSFSYIDQSMVDRKGKTGTVKQDKTYVRAGSKLENRKNSMQVVLNKGATVEITGESDGFYQIKPPNGATLFISKQYVKPVEAAMRTGLLEKHVTNPEPVAQAADAGVAPTDSRSDAKDEHAPPPTAEPGRIAIPADRDAEPKPGAAPSSPQSGTTPNSANGTEKNGAAPNETAASPDAGSTDALEQPNENQPATPKPGKARSSKPIARRSEPAPPAPPATGKYKAMLTLLEGELAEMTRRPFEEQDFTALAKKYEPIADQTEEKVPSQIARIRIRQLNDRSELRLAQRDIEKDERSLADLHANMDKERAEIMRRRVKLAAVTYDLEGELRESFAFAPENRRYRLVDPVTKVTTAYVDIPTSVHGNPNYLIGQLVGIKTAGKKFSPSARVPIAVASEVVDLSPRKNMGDAAMRHASTPVEPGAKEAAAPTKDDGAIHVAAPVHENLPPPLNDEKPATKRDENAVKIQPPKEQPEEEPNSDSPEPTSDAGDKAEP